MRFKDWIGKHFPSFEDKLLVCAGEIQSAAEVVDIDASAMKFNVGTNKGGSVETLSRASKGRCRFYVNEKEFDGMMFPHFVFLNLRASYSDSSTGKAIPSVVDTLSILFEKYKSSDTSRPDLQTKVILSEKAETADQTKLVNEQRNWYAKLDKYSRGNKNSYFTSKGIPASWIERDAEVLNFRNGYSPRYGVYTAVPLRRFYSDSFAGFQRIFENGAKIMIREFNPNGLCSYFPSSEEANELKGVKAVIYHEGHANALLAHFMCKDIGLDGVVNLGCMYADNLHLIAQDVGVHLPECKKQLCIYDNDANGKGVACARDAQAKNSNIQLNCFELNDLAKVVEAYGYKRAMKMFGKLVLSSFK